MSEHDDGTNVLVRFDHVKVDRPASYCLALSVDDYGGVWLPKSQVANIDEDAGEVWLPLWLAEKRGLEYE